MKSRIPHSILVVLNHIIQARGQCAAWFAGYEKVTDANQSHQYAINVFKVVQQILTASPTPDHILSPELPQDYNKIALTNHFAGLEVEDLASDPEETIPQPNAAEKKPKMTKKRYELNDPLENYYMELFFFFNDMHKLRLHIKQIWEDYRDGKVDVASASVTTDYAFELMQRNEKEFYESVVCSYDDHNDEDDLKSYEATGLFLLDKMLRDHEVEQYDDKFEEFACENYNRQGVLCIYIYSWLRKGVPGKPPEESVERAYTEDIAPHCNRELLSTMKKIKEDSKILYTLIPDIYPLHVASCGERWIMEDLPIVGPGVAFKDKISAGLWKVSHSKSKALPIWLVFAVQILVDIFHVTRYQTGRALAEVRRTAAKHEKTLNAYCEYLKDKKDSERNYFGARDGTLNEEKILQAIRSFINEWVYKDRIGKLRSIFSPELKRHPFWLLTYHPMLCGAYIFSMNLAMQRIGRGITLKMLVEKARLQKETPSSTTDANNEQSPLPYQRTLKQRKQSKDPAKLSPIQLLDALCIALNSEYTSLNFDYISFHMRSWKLLREIHTKIKVECLEWMEETGEDVVPDDWETSDQVLDYLPLCILKNHQLAYEAFEKEKWKLEEMRKGICGPLLFHTWRIIDKLAREEGDVESKKIETLREEEWVEAKLMGNSEGIETALPSWLTMTEQEVIAVPVLATENAVGIDTEVEAEEAAEDEEIRKLRQHLHRMGVLEYAQNSVRCERDGT